MALDFNAGGPPHAPINCPLSARRTEMAVATFPHALGEALFLRSNGIDVAKRHFETGMPEPALHEVGRFGAFHGRNLDLAMALYN